MKFLVALSALAAAVSAQSLSGLPSCAETCALNSIGATGCQVTDAKCICSATSFLQGVESCITTACSAVDQAQTLTFAQQFCASAGVTITLPSASGRTIQPASVSASPASSAPASTHTSSAAAVPTLPSNVTGNATVTAPPSQFTGAAAALVHGNWVVAAFGAVMVAAL